MIKNIFWGFGKNIDIKGIVCTLKKELRRLTFKIVRIGMPNDN